MALRFPFRTKATSTTTGTGPYTLTEAGLAGWRTFTRAVTDNDLADGDTVPYIVVDTTVTNGPKLGEVGVGTWNNTAKTLARTQVFQPNSTAVDWGAGTRDVLVIDNPALFLLLAGGTMTGLLKILLSGTIISPAAQTVLLLQSSAAAGTNASASVVSGASGVAAINLGDTDDEDVGGVSYNNVSNALIFRTNGVDRSLIDSSGVFQTAAGVRYDSLPGGGATAVWFRQSSAPAGWVKSTSDNDAALRVVSGTPGASGGTLPLSSTVTGSHILTTSQLSNHAHVIRYGTTQIQYQSGANTSNPVASIDTSELELSGLSDGAGSDTGHTHPLALKYVDGLIATKT